MSKIYYTVENIGNNIIITIDYPQDLARDGYDVDRMAKSLTSSVLADMIISHNE